MQRENQITVIIQAMVNEGMNDYEEGMVKKKVLIGIIETKARYS